jgi:hypothetical protein
MLNSGVRIVYCFDSVNIYLGCCCSGKVIPRVMSVKRNCCIFRREWYCTSVHSPATAHAIFSEFIIIMHVLGTKQKRLLSFYVVTFPPSRRSVEPINHYSGFTSDSMSTLLQLVECCHQMVRLKTSPNTITLLYKRTLTGIVKEAAHRSLYNCCSSAL